MRDDGRAPRPEALCIVEGMTFVRRIDKVQLESEAVNLMAQMKLIVDPNQILNPYKYLPSGVFGQ